MEHSVILFDGICNLCNGFVRFIIKHDKQEKFKFASLQSEAAKKIMRQFNFPDGELKTIVLVDGGKIYLRSRAVLKIASQLNGAWKLATVFYLIPSFLSDALYNVISKYRYKVFGKREECMVTGVDLRRRFLE